MKYIVRERLTLIYFVEADTPAEARAKARERPIREFDEVDQHAKDDRLWAEVDPEAGE